MSEGKAGVKEVAIAVALALAGSEGIDCGQAALVDDIDDDLAATEADVVDLKSVVAQLHPDAGLPGDWLHPEQNDD